MRNQTGIKENVTVIGAGITGLLSAIKLRKAGFEVEIVETSDTVCGESSGVYCQIHSGAEYPFDQQSSESCLDGQMAFMRFFKDPKVQKLVFNNMGVTRVLVTESAIDTKDQVEKTVFALKDRYVKKLNSDIRYEALGVPDQIFTQLPPEEYADVNGIATAYTTSQRVLHAGNLATIVKAYAEEIGVKFRLGHHVTDIRYREAPNTGKKFTLCLRTTQHGKATTSITSDQLIIAANASNASLARMINPHYSSKFIEGQYMGLRRMIAIQVPADVASKLPMSPIPNTNKLGICTNFAVFEQGGMLAPIGGNEHGTVTLLGYVPNKLASQMEKEKRTRMPKDWQTGLQDHQDERSQEIFRMLSDRFPVLKANGVKVVRAWNKVALMNSDNYEVRHEVPPSKVVKGCHEIAGIKATTAVKSADDVVGKCIDDMGNRAQLTAVFIHNVMEEARTSMELPKKYREDEKAFYEDARKQARAMGLPEDSVYPLHTEETSPNMLLWSVPLSPKRGNDPIDKRITKNVSTPERLRKARSEEYLPVELEKLLEKAVERGTQAAIARFRSKAAEGKALGAETPTTQGATATTASVLPDMTKTAPASSSSSCTSSNSPSPVGKSIPQTVSAPIWQSAQPPYPYHQASPPQATFYPSGGYKTLPQPTWPGYITDPQSHVPSYAIIGPVPNPYFRR